MNNHLILLIIQSYLLFSVFGSMDRSRTMSLNPSGQCRLAALIMCILDSCQLYDYTVKILFRLHASKCIFTLGNAFADFFLTYDRFIVLLHAT